MFDERMRATHFDVMMSAEHTRLSPIQQYQKWLLNQLGMENPPHTAIFHSTSPYFVNVRRANLLIPGNVSQGNLGNCQGAVARARITWVDGLKGSRYTRDPFHRPQCGITRPGGGAKYECAHWFPQN